MTGLSPEEDRILEVAAIATGWDLEPMAEFTGVVRVEPELMQRRMVGKFWEENPESYAALVAQNETGLPAAEVERQLIEWMGKHFSKSVMETELKSGTPVGKVILAGNSIHQDRRFIEREWPELEKLLHYRMLDVSAWKVYFEGARDKHFVKPENHRALDDIKGSIEELKWYLSFMKERK